MALLKCLCVFSVIAFTYEQLSAPGATCPNNPKGKCAYEKECPASRSRGYCGADEERILLWCCIPPATTKVLHYYIDRYLPEITQCGRSRSLNQIFGGDRTEIGEYPWMAALLYVATNTTTYGGVKCGGTLINEKFVLTAAHCVIGQTAESIRALLGDWNITSDPDPFPATAKIEYADKVINATIDKIISHELYSSKTKRNDIALLRLQTPVNFTDYVRPVCLPPEDFPALTSNTDVFVAGWGTTETGSQSDVLLQATLYVLTNNECLEKITKTEGIHRTEFCAAHGESDACSGDSGGPLMRSYEDYGSHWFQLGIVESGGSCKIGATATVYTRVSSFFNWIIGQITPQSERDSPCRTPDNKNGSCVLLHQCPVLEQQYLQLGSSSEAEFIRRSLCGVHGDEFESSNKTDMVCCRLSEIKRENAMEGSSCKTPKPESKDGRCERITNCPALKNASKAAREDIEKYQCGFDHELLVCCKTQDIVVASEPKYLEEFSSANIPNRTICGRISDNTKSEYPWLAAIVWFDPKNRSTGYSLRCAGSLINKRYVVSTATCDIRSILNYGILLGTGILLENLLDCDKTSDCPSSMQFLTVEQRILHPFFHFDINNIALLRLGSDVVFNDYVSPICLSPPNLQPLRGGSEVTVATWASKVIENTTAYLWNAQSCIENPDFRTISKQQLCILTNDTTMNFNFCYNPVFGGPIVRVYKDQLGQNLFLEGIHLAFLGCLDSGYSLNVRISAYTSWILRTITKTT